MRKLIKMTQSVEIQEQALYPRNRYAKAFFTIINPIFSKNDTVKWGHWSVTLKHKKVFEMTFRQNRFFPRLKPLGE